MGSYPVDMLGFEISDGDNVARATYRGQLDIQLVTSIKYDKIYLDNSNQPIRHPERLLNLTSLRDSL